MVMPTSTTKAKPKKDHLTVKDPINYPLNPDREKSARTRHLACKSFDAEVKGGRRSHPHRDCRTVQMTAYCNAQSEPPIASGGEAAVWRKCETPLPFLGFFCHVVPGDACAWVGSWKVGRIPEDHAAGRVEVLQGEGLPLEPFSRMQDREHHDLVEILSAKDHGWQLAERALG